MNLQVFEGNGTREASQDIKKKKEKKGNWAFTV